MIELLEFVLKYGAEIAPLTFAFLVMFLWVYFRAEQRTTTLIMILIDEDIVPMKTFQQYDILKIKLL